jgi:hypothetical protein
VQSDPHGVQSEGVQSDAVQHKVLEQHDVGAQQPMQLKSQVEQGVTQQKVQLA